MSNDPYTQTYEAVSKIVGNHIKDGTDDPELEYFLIHEFRKFLFEMLHKEQKANNPLPLSGLQISTSGNTVGMTPSASSELSLIARTLPGALSLVKYPCDCGTIALGDAAVEYKGETKGTLYTVVIHINDCHRWTRNEIADWLEALPDEIDITFKGGELNESD